MTPSGRIAWNKGKKLPQISREKHWHWMGGSSAYRGEDWNGQRIKCWQRDSFKCRKCGISGIKIHAHHIVPYRISKDNSLENLITVCPRCHTKMENQYRRVGMTHYLEKIIEENRQFEKVKKEGAISVYI